MVPHYLWHFDVAPEGGNRQTKIQLKNLKMLTLDMNELQNEQNLLISLNSLVAKKQFQLYPNLTTTHQLHGKRQQIKHSDSVYIYVWFLT